KRRENYVGTIADGAEVEVVASAEKPPPQRVDAGPGPDPNSILHALRTTWERRDENSGEIRLVAGAAGAGSRPCSSTPAPAPRPIPTAGTTTSPRWAPRRGRRPPSGPIWRSARR